MKTARSFGSYDLAAALADLVDNSIQARAGRVTINVSPHDAQVTVRIRDDGRGMTRDRLIAAMQPASADPELVRDASDLGRFGWGLKSASLSQARVLTVVSWTTVGVSAARWNIDDIEDWSMDLYEGPEALSLLKPAPQTSCGTEVIWTNCDRLLDEGLGQTVDERLSSAGSDPVEVSFNEDFEGAIPCLAASTKTGGYSSYLFAIPGKVLANVYAAYGSRLLEQNVRTYLQAKTGVNKGILTTIAQERA